MRQFLAKKNGSFLGNVTLLSTFQNFWSNFWHSWFYLLTQPIPNFFQCRIRLIGSFQNNITVNMGLWHVCSIQDWNVLVNYIKWYFAEVRQSTLHFSCFGTFWCGKFNVSTTHALHTCKCSGWSLHEIEKVTNFDMIVTDFDHPLELVC